MQSISLGRLLFEPITASDFVLIHRWLRTPHVAERWDGHTSLEDVVERFGDKINSTWQAAYIVSAAGQRVGYIQSYRAWRAGPGWWPGVGESTVGIDQFIGEAALLGKGLGTEMVREFSNWLLTHPDTERIITDPDPGNDRAIRCYRKAGFRDVRVVETPDGPALLMEKIK